ncbi:Uncharacterized protein TCM_041689 [Theobroma cacao]|uniref:Uncharacterized protein n=1 Tax=Theobroma cacao TaxID=3641 RepID=A0A061GXB4_THECC|nr:Uncharacterized protein TCM_041689 [Theobroma cacao]
MTVAHHLLSKFQSRAFCTLAHNGIVVLHIQWCLSLNKGLTQVFQSKTCCTNQNNSTNQYHWIFKKMLV